MLKPKKKITKKEIKRDPFLETVDKIEYSIEKNKNTYINMVIAIIVIFIGGNFFFKNQIDKENSAKSALGLALVAFDNGDFENAKFQLESILSDYDNSESANVANYYLGKIAFENKDFANSMVYLDRFFNSGKLDILIPGTVKMLSSIELKNNNKEKAISYIDKGINNSKSVNTKIDLNLYKALVLINEENKKLALNVLEILNNNYDLSPNQKRFYEELMGMI